jgi:hypothetical protein
MAPKGRDENAPALTMALVRAGMTSMRTSRKPEAAARLNQRVGTGFSPR